MPWRYPISLAAAATAFVLVCAVRIWRRPDSISWDECLFARPDCSLAAGTWGLVAFACLTFGAACAAVFWAKRAYDIEVIPRLGQSRCTDHEAINHPVDKEIFITQELQYLEDLPAGLNRQHIAEQFDRQVHSMFMNLGRTALANVQVAMHVEKVGVTGRLFPVRFRNLKVDRDIHVVVYISRKYSDAVVTWDAATSSGRPIEFTPEDAFDEKLEVFELRFS